MRQGSKALAAALLVPLMLVTAPAVANIITLDVKDFQAGQDVSNVSPGLTLSNVSYQYADDLQQVRSAAIADPNLSGHWDLPTGSFGVSHDLYGANFCREIASGSRSGTCSLEYQHPVLELVFDNPVDFVEIRSASTYGVGGFLAFDVAGALIGGCIPSSWDWIGGAPQSLEGCGYHETPLYGYPPTPDVGYTGWEMTNWLNRSQADISSVWFGWTNLNGGGIIAANRISYGNVGNHSVPEPGTAALLCLGLAGIALRRRRLTA